MGLWHRRISCLHVSPIQYPSHIGFWMSFSDTIKRVDTHRRQVIVSFRIVFKKCRIVPPAQIEFQNVSDLEIQWEEEEVFQCKNCCRASRQGLVWNRLRTSYEYLDNIENTRVHIKYCFGLSVSPLPSGQPPFGLLRLLDWRHLDYPIWARWRDLRG